MLLSKVLILGLLGMQLCGKIPTTLLGGTAVSQLTGFAIKT